MLNHYLCSLATYVEQGLAVILMSEMSLVSKGCPYDLAHLIHSGEAIALELQKRSLLNIMHGRLCKPVYDRSIDHQQFNRNRSITRNPLHDGSSLLADLADVHTMELGLLTPLVKSEVRKILHPEESSIRDLVEIDLLDGEDNVTIVANDGNASNSSVREVGMDWSCGLMYLGWQSLGTQPNRFVDKEVTRRVCIA